jgi:hypothetical protein
MRLGAGSFSLLVPLREEEMAVRAVRGSAALRGGSTVSRKEDGDVRARVDASWQLIGCHGVWNGTVSGRGGPLRAGGGCVDGSIQRQVEAAEDERGMDGGLACREEGAGLSFGGRFFR